MKTKQQFLMLGIIAMMASCSSDNSVSDTEEKVPIQIFCSSSKISTRAANVAANLQDEQFATGSKMNIYLTKTGTNTPIGTNQYNEFTVGNSYAGISGALELATTATDLYYPSDGTGVDAYALYPSVFGSSNTKLENTTNEFTVETDQTSDENYKKSDLMYAWKENTPRANNPIELEFNHCMSKVIVELVPGNGVNTSELANASIKMKAVATATITQNTTSTPYTVTAAAKDGEPVSDIQLGDYDTTNGSAVIIVPQTISSGNEIFQVKIGSGTYKCTAGVDRIFEAGKVHKYTLTVQSTGVVVVSVKIKDWGDGNDYSDNAELQ